VDRRAFLATIAGGLLAAPLDSGLQSAEGGLARIGYLGGSDPTTAAKELVAFQQGLRDAGWVDGKTMTIEHRWAKGDLARMPSLIDDLIRVKSDIIVVGGIPALTAAHQATKTIPIVVAAVFADPVGAGFVTSAAHPGGNITGLTAPYEEIVTKQVQLLTEMVPRLSRLVLLRHEAGPPGATASTTAHAVAAAERVGVTAQVLEVREAGEFGRIFQAARDRHAQAVHVLPSPFFNANRRLLVKAAAQYRLPAVYEFSAYVQEGGLMSYGVDLPAMFRRAASYVDRILKGATPADLPIEQASKFEFVINLKTAKALGLTIPPSLLQRADQVIE
jgi:putative ABC transport system substrate-binding protein